jgi:hypothetical protein
MVHGDKCLPLPLLLIKVFLFNFVIEKNWCKFPPKLAKLVEFVLEQLKFPFKLVPFKLSNVNTSLHDYG